MWILPKQLTLAFAPDMEALTSDLTAASQACEQLLTVRSKHVQSKHFLREWKKGNWMRLRFGVISKPFLGLVFLDWWTSSLEVTLVNHLVMQEIDLEQTTQDTCGLTLQQELPFLSQEYVSLKMLKDISRWDFPQSLVIWKNWVIKCRGEYFQRLKLEPVINENECLSLPTPCANEDSFRLNGNSQQSKTLEAKARRGELKTAGFVKNVKRMCFAAANASMMNLNVLNAENGHTHSTGNQQMDVQIAEHHGRIGTTQKAGPLNPQFVEVMMGVPIGWTDCAY